MKSKLFLLVVMISLSPGSLRSATVTADAGNIFLVGAEGKRLQLTKEGIDSEPAVAPNGKLIVFVRRTSLASIAAGSGEPEANELWLIDSSGRNAHRIIRARASADMKEVLAGLSFPVFSPDSKTIYFLSVAWATSNAVHSVDLDSQHIRFVVAGNSLELVPSGRFSGDLIVQQHRYWLGGGS